MIENEAELDALDLRAGDKVSYREDSWPVDTELTGKLVEDEHGCLLIGGTTLVPGPAVDDAPDFPWPVTVVVREKAPRPYYTNHARTEPVDSDVMRDAVYAGRRIFIRSGDKWWVSARGLLVDVAPGDLPAQKMLLVNGDTGLVVAAHGR